MAILSAMASQFVFPAQAGVILSRPARTRTASSASSWAEPRCSTIRRTPCSLATICTAVAPEAVRTFRTNGLTPPPYNHPLVPRTHHPDRTTPTKNPHHDATSPKLARVRSDGAQNFAALGILGEVRDDGGQRHGPCTQVDASVGVGLTKGGDDR